jgi:hypothetical protein
MLVLPSGVRFVLYILRLANLPRPTVPKRNNSMNYLLMILTIGGVVVIEPSSRSRVTWFKSTNKNREKEKGLGTSQVSAQLLSGVNKNGNHDTIAHVELQRPFLCYIPSTTGFGSTSGFSSRLYFFSLGHNF